MMVSVSCLPTSPWFRLSLVRTASVTGSWSLVLIYAALKLTNTEQVVAP